MKRILFIACTAVIVACGNQESTNNQETTPSQEEVQEPNLVTEEISYKADGITMNGYLVYDANIEGKRPGVIVVHEWWGHNAHTRNAAEKLAEDGYVAFAVDMYGEGKTAAHPNDAGAFAGEVMKNFDGAKDRFNAALDVLKSSEYTDSNKIAALGYCFGGGVVLNMARQGADLDGVATMHGSLGAIRKAKPGDIQGKVLVLTGGDDPFVPVEEVDKFKSEMDSAQVSYEVISYPGAKHAYTNPMATSLGEEFELPLAYDEEATKASWKEFEKFLVEVFK